MVKSTRRSQARGARPVASVAASVATSLATTPASSAYPSPYPTEDEAEDDDNPGVQKGFPFLSLPSELRNKIYSLVFSVAPPVLDLDPTTFTLLHRNRTLAIFRVCRQVHLEATHQFFSTHTIRIFPICPGRYFKTKKPLLARLPAHYRQSIRTLELRLGPGWNNPPKGWTVNDALGLGDCISVHILKVFCEVDPSDSVFSGFRANEGFYESFSQGLLRDVLKQVPTIEVVEFDAYPSVKRTGDMMRGLGMVINNFKKLISWGPERGWKKESDQIWLDALLTHEGGPLTKSVAVFA